MNPIVTALTAELAKAKVTLDDARVAHEAKANEAHMAREGYLFQQRRFENLTTALQHYESAVK